MFLGDFDQGLSSSIRLTPALLPILQRAYRYPQEFGELRLGEIGLLARSHNDIRVNSEATPRTPCLPFVARPNVLFCGGAMTRVEFARCRRPVRSNKGLGTLLSRGRLRRATSTPAHRLL